MFVSLPSRQGAGRMRIWRGLRALGCAALRDGVYLLPETPSHATALAAMADEVVHAGGTADIYRLSGRDARQQAELPALFERGDEYAALERGADLVIGTRPPAGGIRTSLVARLPVYGYVPPGHPIAAAGRVRLDELVGHDLLLLTPDFHARRALDAALDADQLPHGPVTEFTSSQVAQAVAAAGRGVAVVSDDPRFGLRPLLIEVRAGLVRINLHAAWHPQHHAADQLSALVGRRAAFVARRYP